MENEYKSTGICPYAITDEKAYIDPRLILSRGSEIGCKASEEGVCEKQISHSGNSALYEELAKSCLIAKEYSKITLENL